MKDLTQGAIGRHLLRMSAAFQLNLFAGTLLSLANIYWLGRLGADAQAAVTLAGILVMLLLSLLPIVNVGAGILIAQAVGAGHRERANAIFNEAFGAALIASALFGAIAWTCRDRFGALIATDPAVAGLIARYFRWFVPSVMVQVPMFVLTSALNFTGNVRVGAVAQLGMVVVNAVLTPLLMFGRFGAAPLGIEGAGLATFLACGVALAALLAYTVRGRTALSLRPRTWLARPRTLAGALKLGLPVGIEGAIAAACLSVVAWWLRPFGAHEQAAFGIGQRVFQAGLIPLLALGQAINVLASQNHGAGLESRVRETLRTGLRYGLTVAPLLLIAFEVAAPWICGRFSGDAAVIAAGSVFLRIVALGLIPMSCAYAAFAVLSGMGNTRAGLCAQAVGAGLTVLVSAIASRMPGFGPPWLWAILAATNGVQAVLGWHFVRKQLGAPGGVAAASTAAFDANAAR